MPGIYIVKRVHIWNRTLGGETLEIFWSSWFFVEGWCRIRFRDKKQRFKDPSIEPGIYQKVPHVKKAAKILIKTPFREGQDKKPLLLDENQPWLEDRRLICNENVCYLTILFIGYLKYLIINLKSTIFVIKMTFYVNFPVYPGNHRINLWSYFNRLYFYPDLIKLV